MDSLVVLRFYDSHIYHREIIVLCSTRSHRVAMIHVCKWILNTASLHETLSLVMLQPNYQVITQLSTRHRIGITSTQAVQNSLYETTAHRFASGQARDKYIAKWKLKLARAKEDFHCKLVSSDSIADTLKQPNEGSLGFAR